MSKWSRWTPERRQEAARLYRSGLILEVVARKMNTSSRHLRDILQQEGVEMRHEGWRKPWTWTPERDEQVALLYRQGLK